MIVLVVTLFTRVTVAWSAPPGRIDQPLDRLDVGGALRRLACRRPERLPCASGSLPLRIELDRAGVRPVSVGGARDQTRPFDSPWRTASHRHCARVLSIDD